VELFNLVLPSKMHENDVLQIAGKEGMRRCRDDTRGGRTLWSVLGALDVVVPTDRGAGDRDGRGSWMGEGHIQQVFRGVGVMRAERRPWW
jgi:hypothetical protein